MSLTVNPLLICIEPYIKILDALHLKRKDASPLVLTKEALHKQGKDVLNRFDCMAHERGVEPETIYKSKYALIALLDESVIRLGGEISTQWMANPLQLEYFGEINAGQRFFSQLDEIRLQGERFIDALEIYYLCLELGFKGRYHNNNQPELIQLKHALLSQIQTIRPNMRSSFYIKSEEPSHVQSTQPRFSFKHLAWAGSAVVCFTAFFLISLISYQAYQDRKTILNNPLAPQIMQEQ